MKHMIDPDGIHIQIKSFFGLMLTGGGILMLVLYLLDVI